MTFSPLTTSAASIGKMVRSGSPRQAARITFRGKTRTKTERFELSDQGTTT